MNLPEVHVWRDWRGRPMRCEFHDGEQRIELHALRVVAIDTPMELPRVEFTIHAKPIYHDEVEA